MEYVIDILEKVSDDGHDLFEKVSNYVIVILEKVSNDAKDIFYKVSDDNEDKFGYPHSHELSILQSWSYAS